MQKQLFLAMLSLSTMGGAALIPAPAMASVAQAQTIKVSGQVVDQDGEPLLGATVKVKNSKSATVTDIDGNFQLDVPSNATLVVSYVGYKDREVAVRGRAALEPIQLESDNTVLDQVVVVGYGVQKKADLTGSVSIVNADELKRTSNSNISTMLEGKVAGVQITSDGQPGADPSVRIRGLGSFGSTNPLYVIDGVPMGTTIRDFSPNDIETIQVLKDAAAGAIYGAQAANGVVIITTKNGKKDQPLKMEYNGYVGFDNINSGTYDVMNADQYSNYLGQACANNGIAMPGGYTQGADGTYYFQGFNTDGTKDMTDTDWFKEVFKTGIRQNHNVAFSGGGAHNTYNISVDYFSQKGTLQGAGPNYERFNFRANNNFDTKFVKFRTGIVYAHSNEDGMGISNASEYVQGLYGDVTNVLRGTLLMQPTIKAYDESTWCLDDKVAAASEYEYDAHGYGVYYTDIHGDISASNPLLVNNMIERNTRVDRLVATGSADVDILNMFGINSEKHSWHYNLNLSYNRTYCKDYTWIPSWIQSNRVYLAKSNEALTEGYRNSGSLLMEHTMTYDGHLGKNNINFVAGITYQNDTYHTMTGTSYAFSEPYYLQLSNGTEYAQPYSYESKHIQNSYFGRLNYNYDEKYLLSVIVRRDGSSRLKKDIRWGTFPSVSVGWRFDKEKFFPIDHNIVNMFKVRASYGELGNVNALGEYAYTQAMSRNNLKYSFGGTAVSGSGVLTYITDNLSWEKKSTSNVGIDLAMFNNRIEFTAEYYYNKSTDLLYGVPVPTYVGVTNSSVTMNAASMSNSGFEVSATYRNRDHAFKYDISGNISTTRNKVLSLGFGTESYLTGAYLTEVGEEVGKFYGYVYEGIARTQEDLDNHATQQGANIGDCLYKDLDGDGEITTADQQVLGSGMPKLNFGLSFHCDYKNFDLAISTYGALGFHVADDIYNSLNSCYGYANKDVNILNANKWSDDGSTYISDVPRTYINGNEGTDASLAWNDLFSERKIQNANYWKIANVQLGYNFPDKWFHNVVNGVRAYVSIQNLCTISGYKGYNVDFAPGTFTPGYNFCSYPSARTVMFGLHFAF